MTCYLRPVTCDLRIRPAVLKIVINQHLNKTEFNFAVEQSKKKTSNLRINSLSSRIHKAENRIILLLCSLCSTNTLKQFLTLICFSWFPREHSWRRLQYKQKHSEYIYEYFSLFQVISDKTMIKMILINIIISMSENKIDCSIL